MFRFCFHADALDHLGEIDEVLKLLHLVGATSRRCGGRVREAGAGGGEGEGGGGGRQEKVEVRRRWRRKEAGGGEGGRRR